MSTADPGQVTVYWRPGCGFCAGLFRGLERKGFTAFARRDIWEDPEAAAFVRSVADGNEVVPTVTIGEVSLVNPSADQVLAAVAEQAPDAVPEGWSPPEPGRVAGFLTRVLGG